MEIDYEIKEILNNLIGITLEICKIYQDILNALIKNDNVNLKLSIDKLMKTKKVEDTYYENLKDNIGQCMLIVDFLNKNKLTSKDTIDLLAFERISNMVHHINFMFYADNPELFYGNTNNSKAQELLHNNGFDEDEIKSIIIKTSYVLQKSLLVALNNIRLQTINNSNNDYLKVLYYNKMITAAILNGDSFENELIEANFSFIPSKLNNELSSIISMKGKQKLINSLLEKNMINAIKQIMTCNDPELFDDYFLGFKSYIIHLDEEELNRYKEIISIQSICYSYDPRMLLNEIDRVLAKRKNNKHKK